MLGANVLCLKKKKKRTYCLSSCKSYEGGSKNIGRSRGGTVTMMQITEDTPPDMLAGAMDLTVHLPNGKAVKTSVERSTPMMDLLVQITTANHLQLSNHTLQVLGMAPSSEYSDKVLPFKPNTPIGTLDTQHIRVLPKGKTISQPKLSVAPGHQPFESTFRLKVHLPRNQLYVTRVSRNVLLEDIMKKVCEEKNLDPLKYDFKRPGNLDEILDPKLTLSDYQITEIYVVSKRLSSLNQLSPADIMMLRREEERKQMHNKSGGGVLNLIFKKVKPSMGSGSVSSNDNRSLSPTHSDDSRSVTPPAVPPLKKDPPRPPQRKRRPAPKPPQLTPQISVSENEKTAPSSVVSTNEEEEDKKPMESNGLTICHSRNSSDSSGYHEASILSEHGASLGRTRPKSAFVGDLPSNLSQMAGQSRSTTSLVAGRKKKAAPPPPPAPPVAVVSPANSVIAPPSPPLLVASQPDTRPTTETILSSSPLEGDTPALLQSSSSKSLLEEKSLDSTDSGIAQDRDKEPDDDSGFRTPPPPPLLDDASFILNDTHKSEETVTPPTTTLIEEVKEAPKLIETPTKNVQDMDDWQYQLPSPPKAFRDSSPPIEAISNYSASESDFKDSVVTSPELFEKLRNLEDRESASSEEPPLNTLSLEHLEKRKSLVYNRELATSLKMTDKVETKPKYSQQHQTLPNFKISTYDVPKHQNIKVFEDDTVRSNENVTFRNKTKVPIEINATNGPGTGVSRSGSFSTESCWSPTKPVSRSKSTLTLNKYQPPKEPVVNGNGVISRSSSLFDVSGLHSLEVMKQIRTKLHSPDGSSEDLKSIPQKPEPVSPPDLSPVEPKAPSPQAVRKYYYRGPPAVNMTTWSERPKVPVAVKEDEDYKLGNVNHKTEITQHSGNVVIKIGSAVTTSPSSTPTTAVNSSTKLMAPAGYRRPLASINGAPQRPHSFLGFDPNRAPVVRGVEFKKPFKDFQIHNNKSVVHLNSPEDVTLRPSPKNGSTRESAVSNRASWAGSYNTLPGKPKVEPHHTYETNQKVPFSRSTLRRTESSKLYEGDQHTNVYVEKNNNYESYNSSTSKVRQQPGTANPVPPPPPQMPKLTLKKVVQLEKIQSDPRDQLMESIRSFGGKKGLKTLKA